VHVAHPIPPEVPHTSIIVPVTSELCTQTSLELVQTVPVGQFITLPKGLLSGWNIRTHK